MGGAVGDGRGSGGREGQWGMRGVVGNGRGSIDDGRGSREWEGQWGMGGAVGDGRGVGNGRGSGG